MKFRKGWYIPFEDFFSQLPNDENIEDFGKEARLMALDFCKQKRSVIDVGAHIGISVNHWASNFNYVYAFEPLQDHYDCLLRNTSKLENLKTFCFAAGNFDGTTQGAYRSLKNSGSFQMLDENYTQPKAENKVRKLVDIYVRKLDSFTFDHVDLIKIDVEGWEYEVIEGAVETIKKHKPVLMIEVLEDHPNKTLRSSYDFSKINRILAELNYKEAAHIKPDDKIFIPNE